MRRYIDADEFVEKIIERAKDLRQLNTKTIGEALDDCKTINPEDFRPKGKWKDNGKGGYQWGYVCSECGCVDGHPFNDRHNFCPNCGEKMEVRSK